MSDNFLADDIFKNIGRNESCPCGSGRKFKKCHLLDIEAARALNVTAEYSARKKLVRLADDFPVYKCLIGKDWKIHGLARLVIARTQPNGRLVYGAFLADIFCLGIKSAFCNAEMPVQEFNDAFISSHFFNTEPQIISLNFAKTVIYGSIAYARDLGFEPDEDFNLASNILGGNDFKQDPKVKFGGPRGVPLYIIGPNDNSRQIIINLEKKLGQEGFEVFDPRI